MEVEWAKSFSTDSLNLGKSIAVDGSGNTYIIGYFQDTISFGTINLTAAGSSDIFVCKLDNSGNILWAKNFGSISYEEGRDIAVDGSGNLYITGYFQGTLSFGTIDLTTRGSEFDMFVCKLDNSGNTLWAKNFGGGSYTTPKSIAIDGSGNSYIIGRFYVTVSFGTFVLTSSGSSHDMFVCKLDNSGNVLWAKNFDSISFKTGSDIAVDGSGNSYITGYFQDIISFGTIDLTPGGSFNETFVCKLDSDGNVLWAKNFGGTASVAGECISVDGSGNSYISGNFYDTISFGVLGVTDLTTMSLYYSDIYVCKLDNSGTVLWAKSFGSINSDMVYDIAVDGSGNSYITGSFIGTISFGGTNLTSVGATDIYVCKLDNSGTVLWSKNFGNVDIDSGKSIAVDGSGNSYITGYFKNTISFGETNLTAVGPSSDIFVCKLRPKKKEKRKRRRGHFKKMFMIATYILMTTQNIRDDDDE